MRKGIRKPYSHRLIMLRVDTILTGPKTTVLRLEGRLDRRSLPILAKVCEKNLKKEETVILNMEGIDHISKEGRDYLKSIKSRVQFVSLSEYLKIELM